MSGETQLLAAFVVGLLGGVHCVGMCGGIVGALVFGLPEERRRELGSLMPFLLAYNGGRLVSYTVAGALLGGVGWLAANLTLVYRAQQALAVVAGLFMVALGCYLAGWWMGLRRLERAGGYVWRRMEPIGRRLLPVANAPHAFLLGLLWGWLPCGLVYSVLVWSISAGSAVSGGLLMLSFGLGTLPTLLAAGAFAGRLSAFVRRIWVRRLAGGTVVLFGLVTLAQALLVPAAA